MRSVAIECDSSSTAFVSRPKRRRCGCRTTNRTKVDEHMMTTRIPGAALALTLAITGLAGCKESATKNTEATPSAPAPAEKPAAPAETAAAEAPSVDDNALNQKLGKYIDCYNRMTSSVVRTQKRYFSWVDEKTGPTGKERNVYGLYEISFVDQCEKDIAAGNAAKPEIPELHAEATAYQTAATELAKQVNEAVRYYDQNDYKDDKWEKAKTFHTALVAGFEKFKTANEAFEKRIRQLNDEVSLRELEKLEKDPNARLEALTRRTMHEAKGLLQFIEIESIDALDADAYEAKLKALDTAITALRTYTETNKAEAERARGLDSLLDRLQGYLTASKELQRRKRDNKDFAKEKPVAGQFNRIEGHPAQIIDKYNEVVSASNRMTW
jgi:hypothetical protein